MRLRPGREEAPVVFCLAEAVGVVKRRPETGPRGLESWTWKREAGHW